jgi:TatD DNase family protein
VAIQWVDTHAHLDDRQFDGDRDAVVRRAAQAGVKWMVTIGADLPSSRAAVALCERYPNVYAAVGAHPHDAKSLDRTMLDILRDLAAHPRVVAIGEIGLDYYRDRSPRDVQRTALEAQLALATELGKPVVIHIRDERGQRTAYDQALSILRTWLPDAQPPNPPPTQPSNHPAAQPPNHRTTQPPGVLHCFSGDLQVAHAALALGFCIGVDGPVTYPSAGGLRAIVAQLPLDRLLLETDCPYLPPQAWRGRRNEPAYLTYIAAKVAEVKGVDLAKVAEVTTANAARLFCLPIR